MKLLSNISYLVVAQLISYLVPLLLIPFYIKEFEQGDFAAIMLFIAMVQLGYILCEFGVNISLPKRIIEDKGDSSANLPELNFIIILLKLLVTSGYSLLCYFILDFSLVTVLFLFLTVYFQSIQFLWVYIAKENFKKISLINFFNKLVYVCTFIFVFYFYTSTVFSVYFSLMLSQVAMFIWTLKENDVTVEKQKRTTLLNVFAELKAAFPFFLSRVYSFGQYYVFMPILSVTSSTAILAQAGCIDSILKALRGLLGSFVQVAFPFFTRDKSIKKYFSVFLFLLCCSVVGYYLFELTFSLVVELLFGEEFSSIKEYSLLVYLCVTFSFFSSFLGFPLFTLVCGGVELCRKTTLISFLVFIFSALTCYLTLGLGLAVLLKIQIVTELLMIIIRLVLFFNLKQKSNA